MSTDTMISINRAIDGPLPDGWTGIEWTDTAYTECRDHIEDNDWDATVRTQQPDQGFDTPVGRVLLGEVSCDPCRERDQQT